MNILSKLCNNIKSFWLALNKEPENSVLDIGIPADPNGEDTTTDEQSGS